MSTLSIGRYTMSPVAGADSVKPKDGASTDGLDGADSPAESKSYTAVTIEFSPAAQLYGKLDHLSQTDPAKFKKVMGEMADGLRDVADQSSGADGRAINNLANEFGEAARTGKARPLAPSSLPASFNSPYGSGNVDDSSDILAQATGTSSSYRNDESDSTNLAQLGGLFHDLMAKISPNQSGK
ncbi:MAG: hypothetical protein P4L33_18105 [Capsulimonadaceae bacterium]|nr:hypothetical protein [Capsulimonadaceae bacterium]